MLHGRTAVVTGSTSGIGLGIAKALARAGSNVVLNGFGEWEMIRQIAQELEQAGGGNAFYHPADLTRTEDCAALISEAKDRFGSVDILVNNAGTQYVAPVEEFPLDRWDAILALNLSAAFHTTRAALPFMRQKGWGRLINIVSVHGLVASIHKCAYVAAKHGLMGLTKVIALETARENITCNAICPGFVLTPLIQKQIDNRMLEKSLKTEEAQRDLLVEKQPSLQFTKIDDVAGLAVFLCGETAANITGASLPIDGGWTAQ